MGAFFNNIRNFFLGGPARQWVAIILIILMLFAGGTLVLRLAGSRAEFRRQAVANAHQRDAARVQLAATQATLKATQAELAAVRTQLAAAQKALATAQATIKKYGLDKDVEMPAFERVVVSGLKDKLGNEDTEQNAIAGQAADERLSFLHRRELSAPVLNIKFTLRLSSEENLVGRWWFQEGGAEPKGVLELLWPETFRGSGEDVINAFADSYRTQKKAPGGRPGALAPQPSASASVTPHKI